jgi:hypothetical protein
VKRGSSDEHSVTAATAGYCDKKRCLYSPYHGGYIILENVRYGQIGEQDAQQQVKARQLFIIFI